MAAVNKLARDKLRKLKVSESASEQGVTYTKLAGDGRWSVNVMVNRVRHHVVVGLESQGFTRTQCDELVARLKAGARERVHGIRQQRAVTFKQACTLYLAYLRDTGGNDIAKKQQRINLHLVPHLGGLTLGTMTEADLRRYSTKRTGEGASPGTVNRELAIVSHLFRLASSRQAMNLIPAAPCSIDRLREPEQAPVYLRPEEAAALLRAAEGDSSLHVYAFIMVGLHTGMRRESILRIRLADLDFDRRVLWVDRDKTGERQQPMTSELVAFLREYTAPRADGSTWLFPSSRGANGHVVNITKPFDRCVLAAGLPDNITPHKLRHTMATMAAHAGIDGPTIQAMGGWKSRRMVERYTHAGSLTDAMNKLQQGYSGSTITPKLPSTK